MEFDKSRVYTAVNADELPIGSMCVFGDTIADLQKGLDAGEEFGLIWPLEEVFDEYEISRFKNERGRHILAYLVELPVESKNKPFSSTGKTKEIAENMTDTIDLDREIWSRLSDEEKVQRIKIIETLATHNAFGKSYLSFLLKEIIHLAKIGAFNK